MQHIYGNNTEVYGQLTHYHQNSLQSHHSYRQENQSISPQQSSTSDVDEASPIPSSTINRVNNTTGSKITKKKKPTKKKRKDPNEPQKPVSPYALFFRDAQNDIKKRLANPSFGEISKVVAHMWENIEPEIKEEYKRRAATAKKEYLKQLAAYRAVQVAHQTPNLPHFLNQTSLPFSSHAISHHQKPYHTASMMSNNNQHQQQQPTFQQYCSTPSSSSVSSIQHQSSSFNTNFHYVNPYSQDNTNVYHSDHQNYFPNHAHQSYSAYDSNNNYPDYHQYGLLRPVIDSEHYSSYYSHQTSMDNEHIKTNENLLHNLNNNTSQYVDLTSMANGQIEKHYDYTNHGHPNLHERKNDEHSSMITICNENHFRWN
ncbi:unnamed protein product [Adineta ricciae]|uniref:HMG box domain-containing protein n=1 Tax=Adineta ricciae TaxID=249248 RepID=A0A815B717_ADIRI|nr:unnamed protein product [Adineta ricciae]CAF1467852.1 unnamed protein product [Adineta ricciae]